MSELFLSLKTVVLMLLILKNNGQKYQKLTVFSNKSKTPILFTNQSLLGRQFAADTSGPGLSISELLENNQTQAVSNNGPSTIDIERAPRQYTAQSPNPSNPTASTNSYGSSNNQNKPYTYTYRPIPVTVTDQSCYLTFVMHSAACLVPFERRVMVDLGSCLRLCDQNLGICASAQYKGATGQCDLFTSMADPYYIYKRRITRDVHTRLTRLPRSYQITGSGYTNAPFSNSFPSGTGTGNSGYPSPSIVTPNQCTYAHLIPTANSTFYVPTECIRTTGPGLPATSTVTPEVLTTPTTVTTSTTTPAQPLPPGTECPLGEVTEYYRVDATSLPGPDDILLPNTPVSECIASCSNNRLPDGNVFGCRSFDFNFGTNECALRLDSLFPSGTSQPVPDPDSLYFEKVCVPEQLAAQCAGSYVRFPQMVLVGQAQLVTDAASLDDCVFQCIESDQVNQIPCNSVMYFHDEFEFNCVLNTETSLTSPEFFVPTFEEAVDYVELDCRNAQNNMIRFAETNRVAELLSALLVERRIRRLSDHNAAQVPLWNATTAVFLSVCELSSNRQLIFSDCRSTNPNTCSRTVRVCRDVGPAPPSTYTFKRNQQKFNDPMPSLINQQKAAKLRNRARDESRDLNLRRRLQFELTTKRPGQLNRYVESTQNGRRKKPPKTVFSTEEDRVHVREFFSALFKKGFFVF